MERGDGKLPPVTPKRVYGNARSVDNSPFSSPGSVINLLKTPSGSTSASLQDTPQTPQSSKSRSCWVFQSYKVGNSYSFEISVKNHSGRTGPLSVCKPAAKYRPSFGSIVKVETETKVYKKSGESVKVFVLTNENKSKHALRQDLLFMLLKSTNAFTQMCQGLIADGKQNLLANYFSVCAHARGFTMFREELFTDDGMLKECPDVASELLGGSLKELQEFISLAMKHATIVGERDAIKDGHKLNPAVRQKRIEDFFLACAPPKKMTKTDVVKDNFRKECEDVDGLEQKLISSYQGFRRICLDNLSVSEKLGLPVNDAVSLSEVMYARFNPSLCVLTVAGEDEGFSEDNKYSVIDGVHRLKALKLLDSQGRFEKLPGIQDRKIECFVLTSTGDPAIDNYCNLRSNDQAREIQSKSGLHELIYVFSFLKKTYNDSNQAREAMERMAKLREVSADDLTSLRRLTTWRQSTLEHLIEVLQKYERFQTTDATGRGNKSRLQKGEKMPLTKAMFKLLSKCPDENFEQHYEKILTRKVSLKEVLVSSSDNEKNQKVKIDMAKEARVANFEVLKQKYPDQIDDDVTQKFAGAVTEGKHKNLAGVLLTKFVQKLAANTAEPEEFLRTKEIISILEFDADQMEKFDVIFINLLHEKPDYIDYVIDVVGAQHKEYKAVLILLHSEQEQRRVITKLDYWNTVNTERAVQNNFQTRQILFQKTAAATNEKTFIHENLHFALLFGKFHVFHPPLMILNEDLKVSLGQIISKISPPSAKIAFVQEGKQDVIRIHPDEDKNGCIFTYFALKSSLDKFLLKDNIDYKQSASQDESYMVDAEEDCLAEENMEFSRLNDDMHENKCMERKSSTSRM